MHYLVVGAGGTGGCLAAKLAIAGLPVDVIARGAHLEAILQDGLQLVESNGSQLTAKVGGYTVQQYDKCPDVVFVCVKGYSIDEIVPLLARTAGTGTVVIPLLNLVGTGGRLAAQLPSVTVLDGCIYVSAHISAPGEITKGGPMLRVVFGQREGNDQRPRLEAIARELDEAGIQAVVSDDIRRDTFRKYMFLSAFAAAGAFLNVPAGQLWEGAGKALFLELNAELQAIAKAQGIVYQEDMTAASLAPLLGMPPQGTTSMQKDLAKGSSSELDGLVVEPLRMGKKYGVPTPAFARVAAKLAPNATV